MRQLHARDGHGDRWRQADAQRLARVVRVHERVNQIVESDEPAARRCLRVLVAVPAVDEHGGVMVPVEEDERLLAQHDEERVDKLD